MRGAGPGAGSKEQAHEHSSQKYSQQQKNSDRCSIE